MAIAAVVEGITVLPNKTVRLYLGPVESETPKQHPGQETMIVVNPPSPPELLRGLIGCVLWGGAGELLLGETVIAERVGYTHVRLLNPGESHPVVRKPASRRTSS